MGPQFYFERSEFEPLRVTCMVLNVIMAVFQAITDIEISSTRQCLSILLEIFLSVNNTDSHCICSVHPPVAQHRTPQLARRLERWPARVL